MFTTYCKLNMSQFGLYCNFGRNALCLFITFFTLCIKIMLKYILIEHGKIHNTLQNSMCHNLDYVATLDPMLSVFSILFFILCIKIMLKCILIKHSKIHNILQNSICHNLEYIAFRGYWEMMFLGPYFSPRPLTIASSNLKRDPTPCHLPPDADVSPCSLKKQPSKAPQTRHTECSIYLDEIAEQLYKRTGCSRRCGYSKIWKILGSKCIYSLQVVSDRAKQGDEEEREA